MAKKNNVEPIKPGIIEEAAVEPLAQYAMQYNPLHVTLPELASVLLAFNFVVTQDYYDRFPEFVKPLFVKVTN